MISGVPIARLAIVDRVLRIQEDVISVVNKDMLHQNARIGLDVINVVRDGSFDC